ncbi:MAG: glycerol-3-phosphate 1-O-acyltransferase PlsY [Bacteroidia bacterium]|nr:glycerol-3-phosphate 1-O-acyltransferase PlsY [Bacteroidia bacterium]
MIYITILLAYFLGSIPSAVWLGKYFYGVDVREHGSGNAGATNVFRTLGKNAGIPVLILDMLKGFAAVNLSWLTDLPPGSEGWTSLRVVLALVSIIGHIFPVFANFRGGKGVATMTGTLIALNPVAALIAVVIFFLVFMLTHYISLSSITTALLLPVVFGAWLHGGISLSLFSLAVAAIIIITHRKNIQRLMKGEESKMKLFGKK